MASAAILRRTRPLLKILSSHDDTIKSKSISTLSFLSQEAQHVYSPLPPPSPEQPIAPLPENPASGSPLYNQNCQSSEPSLYPVQYGSVNQQAPPEQAIAPLPPNPAFGSPLYNQNWRNPNSFRQSSEPSLYPVPYGSVYQPAVSRTQSSAQTYDAQGLKNVFADWITSQRWLEIKQLFEHWVRTLDKNGKPNRPDVDLYNQYLRANFMNGSPPEELLDLVEQMADYGISPTTASFNLILKAMNRSRESAAAEKVLRRMLETGKESLPDDESFNLVIGMLFATDIEAALRILDTAFDSRYMMSPQVFNDCLRSCCNKGNIDSLVSVFEKCQKMDQNKALCPDLGMCYSLVNIATQNDNKDLAFHALKFMARWIARGEVSRPLFYISINEGVIVDVLGIAGRTFCPKLLDGAWEVLKRSLRLKKDPNPETHLAKIRAYSSLGNLPKAFSTLRELETAHKKPGNEAPDEVFSPFMWLKPLVVACTKNGFETLDEVYYQLENLSKANPPFISLAAMNCVILGCANIWDVDRAYQTFQEINGTFGLTPNIDSYNSLLCAFAKCKKRDEAVKVFEHFISLGVKPNPISYQLLVDAHLIVRDPKSALSTVDDMIKAGYDPLIQTLRKIRRRAVREMDNDSNQKVEALARQFKIRMGPEQNRNLLFNLQYTEYV